MGSSACLVCLFRIHNISILIQIHFLLRRLRLSVIHFSYHLYFSFHLGKRKFGILSVMGASYLAIHAITAIAPNESLIPTLTFYILNILPILASGILLSSSANRRLSVY